jgi:osmoprotectant transport system permease protein
VSRDPRRLGSLRVANPVLLSLLLAAGAAAATTGFVTIAPNRLVSGRPILLATASGLPACAALAAIFLMLLAASFLPQRRIVQAGVAALAAAALLLVAAESGLAATRLAATAPLAIVDAVQRAGAPAGLRLLVALALVAAIAFMARCGLFDALAVAREYAIRRGAFTQALLRHLLLVFGSVVPAIAIGVPLGIAASRHERLRGPLFAILNLAQTIPSVALFGLLIVPLSSLATAVPAVAALGIAGIGLAPALIALVLYALLPIVRNTTAGIDGVDRAVVDAGTGVGMSARQILWRVELPLAVPVLLAGLRIVTVQAIGLAIVAALIGAGGLGTFVFQGLGQYAIGLVLLGALPTIALALAADLGLRTLSSALARREAR